MTAFLTAFATFLVTFLAAGRADFELCRGAAFFASAFFSGPFFDAAFFAAPLFGAFRAAGRLAARFGAAFFAAFRVAVFGLVPLELFVDVVPLRLAIALSSAYLDSYR